MFSRIEFLDATVTEPAKTWRRLPSMSLLQRGFNPLTSCLVEQCTNGSHKALTNKEFLELHFTSHKFGSSFGCSPSRLLLTWLHRFCAIDTDKRTETQLRMKCKKVETNYNNLIRKIQKNRQKYCISFSY
ncbi:uncharacterized protein LOC144442617 [Glandiceps talaboti]